MTEQQALNTVVLGDIRGGVPGYVQYTRLKYSKINYNGVIVEGIYTYIFVRLHLGNN